MKPKLIEQNKAKRLRVKGFSLKEIASKLQVNKGSVSVWVRKVPLGKAQKQRLIERELWGEAKGRKKIAQYWAEYRLLHPRPIKKPRWPERSVESFFDAWSPDMAYVLGYFAADGTMYRNPQGSCYFAFTSSDRELIETVKNILRVSNKIEVYQPKLARKLRYTIQISSKKIFIKLLRFGFTPNKSLTLCFPNVPSRFMGHFIRGYFDGDGCAGFYKIQKKDRKNRYLFLTIQFRCGSKKFLEHMKQRLIELTSISHGGVLSFNSRAYSLAYTGSSVVELYRFLYPKFEQLPCLERKKLILKDGILEKYGIEV